MKKKSEAVRDGIKFVEMIKAQSGKLPKFIRMDNSQENKKMAKIIKEKHPNIIFEFTARHTPQQNGRLE